MLSFGSHHSLLQFDSTSAHTAEYSVGILNFPALVRGSYYRTPTIEDAERALSILGTIEESPGGGVREAHSSALEAPARHLLSLVFGTHLHREFACVGVDRIR
jgi:hypothetical protein